MIRHALGGATLAALISLPAAAADDPVLYFSGEQVRAAFARGQPLTENAKYKIHASRREAPGEAERHDRETDIFYVLEGAATLVTGGSVVGGTASSPGEHRGASIDGGTSRRLGRGDVIVVPHGTPHQFTKVDGQFVYYVVKITTAPSAP